MKKHHQDCLSYCLRRHLPNLCAHVAKKTQTITQMAILHSHIAVYRVPKISPLLRLYQAQMAMQR